MVHHRGILEKRVIDSEGIELGVVAKDLDDYIEVSEGLFDELLLTKSFIGKEEEEVILKDNLHNLLVGLDVIDSKDENIGKILEEIMAGDVLDTLIIETTESELLFITLEEIYKIDEQLKLDIDLEEIKYRQKTHTPRDHVKHYLERMRSH
jgi:sporulation protein YlmC with PRC-barrel domain